jgi:hypothetical protein
MSPCIPARGRPVRRTGRSIRRTRRPVRSLERLPC